MARVTIEDCLAHVDSNFELVLKAAKRARAIAHGAQPLVEEEGDKPTVIALREIADGLLTSQSPQDSERAWPNTTQPQFPTHNSQ